MNESMFKRAREKKLADIRVHDLRNWARDKHKKVDDRPFGGGPGMVLKADPIVKAIESLLKPNSKFSAKDEARPTGRQIPNSKKKAIIILFSASGKQFDQKKAREWAKKYERIIMIAGRYEGIDERVKKVIRNLKLEIRNLSIGPYILTGGELPALVVVDAVSRHIPGFLGKEESLEEKRHGVGVPVYTRPEAFEREGKTYRVPKVLLSGNHKNIEEWRKRFVKIAQKE